MKKFILLGLAISFVVALFLASTAYKASHTKSAEPVAAMQQVNSVSEVVQPSEVHVAESEEPAKLSAVPSVKTTAALADISDNGDQLVIADFDTGDKPNNLGGDFGAWNKDPEDSTQGCNVSFETDDALGDPAGYSLKMDYDVDSPHPAYNGVWMKLDGQNASSYNTLSFYVRGDGLNNYTKRIKLELKDSSMISSPYLVSGITESWQKIEVPFERFKKIKDWSSLGEFVVVFDDMNSSPKQGTILIDQISFEKR